MPKILNDVKKKLLQEVAVLLQQGGYSAVTIRSVAAGCGLAVGTVYNYFPSKEALVAQYLLEDWRSSLAAIETAAGQAQTAEPVARCIHSQLRTFSQNNALIFQDAEARSSFAGSFSHYHGLLRSQLAAPLRRFCKGEFAPDFMAEALLTWTVAGKDFQEIWGMIGPCKTIE